MKQIIDIKHLPNSGKKLLLYLPHSEAREESVRNIYNFAQDPTHSFEDIWHYCQAEADWGTRQFTAYLIAELIQKSDFNITIIDIQVPRALIDLNRCERSCLHTFFPESDLKTKDEMMGMYWKIRKEVEPYLSTVDFTFHIHSMAGRNLESERKPVYYKVPDNIPDFCQRAYSGTIRPFNIFYADDSNNPIADKPVSKALLETLNKAGVYTEFDVPYNLGSYALCSQYIKAFRSAGVDIPKNLMATNETANFTDPSKHELDLNKTKHLAELTAQVLIDQV